ncbi:MAG: 16S rRNA (guanine(527)-N(7))-methyltransferase RsmG [Solirubrobacterales bacterium]|nr:16S rRNA (guanine(527)-N(7))-methyltransferase RsmG [Solirubrobacterales bacterium]
MHDHLADSLVALELPEMRAASAIADIGSGAGFPGLPLAIALPHARVWLIESRAPKASFLSLAAVSCGISNVEVVHRRVEECRNLTESFDVVVARALGPLDVVAEYAAPLMEVGGILVVWRGGRDAAADDDAARAGRLLGLEESRSIPVKPYEEVRDRSLYLMRKLRPTPDRFPRRPGVARRRPLGRERQSA